MKRQPILDFFDISSNVEELPRNELFRLRGGYSDGTIDGGELPGVDVPPPPGSPDPDDDPWDWGGDDPHDGWEDDNSDSGGWSDTGGGSGGGGGGSISTPPPTNNDNDNDQGTQQNDPWERDEDGNIIMTVTDNQSHVDYRSSSSLPEDMKVKVILEEVIIKVGDQDITAFRVKEVLDINGNIVTDNLEQYMSNCHGYAFGDGELWFNDAFWSDQSGFDPTPNELGSFEDLLKSDTLYKEVDKSEADYAVIWKTEGGVEFLAHSAIVNSDGSYSQKSDTSKVHVVDSETDFVNTQLPPAPGDSQRVVYYKRNF